MYTIQKSDDFSDKLEIQNAAGDSLVLDIRLSITPQTVREYRALQIRLMDLQKRAESKPGDPETVEQTGQAVADVLTLLFGAENLERMAAFYAGDFVTMLADVFPYIREVIAPKLTGLAKSRREQLKRRFK